MLFMTNFAKGKHLLKNVNIREKTPDILESAYSTGFTKFVNSLSQKCNYLLIGIVDLYCSMVSKSLKYL